MYWDDVKYCPHKKIFLPKNRCEDYEEKENVDEKYVNREELV